MQNDKHKMLSIGGMPDHIHIFIGLNLAYSIPDVVKDVKRASNNWIKSNQFVKGNFEWQSGYSAFSYSRSHISKVCNYIKNQEQHHAKTAFKDEYISLLKAFDIDFKNEYLFEFYD